MACRRATLRYLHPSAAPARKFTTTSSRQRLGAATYAQEWTSGAYHFNKSTSKLVPFAHKQSDKLLQQYVTQQKKKTAANYANKAAIASHRRKYEKVYLSGSRVKDFGGRVEVEAYVFDGAAAKQKEDKAREEKMGRSKGGGAGQQGTEEQGQAGSAQRGRGRRQGGATGGAR